VFCLWTSAEAGQIYQWIDKNGVRHFTNEPPPPGAKIVSEEAAIPYNKAADEKRTQEDQEALERVLNQQESEPEQQAESQQVQSQPETPSVPSGDSDSDETDEDVVAEPYTRDRVRRYERRELRREEIVTPLPRRGPMDERLR
jgi:hypothetical protein